MQGSILVVQIHEALDIPGNPATFTELTFAGQKQVTQLKPATNHPTWNEKFSFDVNSPNESLTINLCSNEFAGRGVIGSAVYPLKSLAPPDYVFDNWLSLMQRDKEVGKIKLSIQWIVSRVEFFQNIINKIEKEIIDSQNELGFYQEKLKQLHGTLYLI